MSETRYSQRIPESKWQLHKTTIHRLYVLENKPLTASEGVRDIMFARHGFMATKAQYETRLKKWGFYKYASAHDRRSRVAMLQSRRAEGQENDRPTGDHECDIPVETYSASQNLPIRTSSPYHSSLQPPPQGIGSRPMASATSQSSITHLATGSLSSHDKTTISNSSLGANMTSGSSWPMLTTDNITATSRAFDYRELSGDSISLHSFAYERNVRDHIGWSNLWPSTPDSFTAHLSETVTSRFTGLSTSQFAISIMPIILRMFPKHGSSASIVFLGDSSVFEMAISSISHPSTSQLVRRLGIDHQFIYMIFQRLINDCDAVGALDQPQTKLDDFFKIGITYCFSLGEEVLVNIIKSTPSPYKLPLIQNIFCAALVLRNGPVLEIIMKLDRENLVNRPVLLGDAHYYPLEYTSTRGDVQATQILLDYGGDPNQRKDQRSIDLIGVILPKTQSNNINPRLQIMRMLLSHGLQIDPDFVSYTGHEYDKDEFSLLIKHCLTKSFKIFFRERRLPRVLLHPAWDDSFTETLRAILDQACLESISCQDLWNSVLTEALSSAVKRSHTSAVDMLLAVGAVPDVHCLISAAQSNDSKISEFLNYGLDPNVNVLLPDDVHIRLDYERNYDRRCDSTALGEAIKNRSIGALSLLQARGAILNSVNRPAGFAIAVVAACQVGDHSLVEHFLSLPNFPSRETRLERAMEGAVAGNHYHIAKKLLSVGIKPSIRSLELAVQKKQLAFVELLASCLNLTETLEANHWYYEMDHGTIGDVYQNGLIMEVLQWGDQTAIEHVLETGHPVNTICDVEAAHAQDWGLKPDLQPKATALGHWCLTPLSLAILKGNSAAMKALIAYGAHAGMTNSRLTSHQCCMLKHDHEPFQGWAITTLAACAIRGDIALIQHFLSQGLDPFDNAALLVCAVLDLEEIVTSLLYAFKNRYPSGARYFGSDALYQSIRDGNTRLVMLLAEDTDVTAPVRGEDFRYYESPFTSPLGEAIRLHSKGSDTGSALDLILPLAENLNTVVHHDVKSGYMTPLLYAISLGSLETVQKLHQAGADISLPAKGLISRTPLQRAAEVGSKEIVQYFLTQDVRPDEPPANRAGATALQLAAIVGNIGIVTTLLDAGANINAQPALCDGRTAFEGAAEHGRVEMVIFLVQQGADLLSNNGEQYRRAIAFADDNLQHATKKLAEDLYQQVLANQGESFLSISGNEWVGAGVDSSENFIF